MSKAQPSEIDRLIQLASDEKPRSAVVTEIPLKQNRLLPVEDEKGAQPSMWRVLLQLRTLLPHLVRVLPLLERGILGTNVLGNLGSVQPRLDTSRFDESLAGLEDAHKDLNVQLKNQVSEIKLLQEQVNWLRKSEERNSLQLQEIAASLLSLRKMVLTAAILGGILLATVIVFLLLRVPLSQ
jgi:hypothetical protein